MKCKKVNEKHYLFFNNFPVVVYFFYEFVFNLYACFKYYIYLCVHNETLFYHNMLYKKRNIYKASQNPFILQ